MFQTDLRAPTVYLAQFAIPDMPITSSHSFFGMSYSYFAAVDYGIRQLPRSPHECTAGVDHLTEFPAWPAP